jgi:hypothetical protein
MVRPLIARIILAYYFYLSNGLAYYNKVHASVQKSFMALGLGGGTEIAATMQTIYYQQGYPLVSTRMKIPPSWQ